MKRYKLLKELPTFAKGDLFEIRDDGCLWWIGNSSFKCGWGQGHWRREVMAYHKNTLERFPNILEEWFEKIEPKEYWYIDPMVCGVYFTKIKNDEDLCEFNKQIGNYFETKEEAEKAMEKLKAYNRLKDKGFRFIDHIDRDSGQGMTRYEWDGYVNGEDLDLLFGGGE